MRLIDADEVHNLIRNAKKYMWTSPISAERKVTVSTDDIQFGIDKIPTVDAVPVVHGHWIDMGDSEQCSACGGTHLKQFKTYYGTAMWMKTNYCPNCGAKMNGRRTDGTD